MAQKLLSATATGSEQIFSIIEMVLLMFWTGKVLRSRC